MFLHFPCSRVREFDRDGVRPSVNFDHGIQVVGKGPPRSKVKLHRSRRVDTNRRVPILSHLFDAQRRKHVAQEVSIVSEKDSSDTVVDTATDRIIRPESRPKLFAIALIVVDETIVAVVSKG